MLTILREGFRTAALRSLVKEAVENGKKCVLLVPEQETLNVESAMARILPPSAPLHFEVSNFSRLANTVFRSLGGICYNHATDAALSLLMWKTLDALAPLLYNGTKAKESGAVEDMLGAVNELYAMGIDERMLEEAAKKLPDGERLKDKLSDLIMILYTYRGEVTHTYGTHAEDLDKLAEKLSEEPFFKDTLFFVDSFTSFTAQERAVLAQLIRQTDVTVALTRAPSIPSLCYEEIEDTRKRLLDIAEGMVNETYSTDTDPLPDAIAHVKEHLFRADKELVPFEKANGSVILKKAKGPFEAADATAADIAERVRSGARLRDFVIFVRDVKKYRGILDAALEKQGLPYFMSAEKDVFSFAVIRMIRSAYSILNKGFRRIDVLDFLKSGFAPCEAGDVDAFEIYTDFWHVSGNAYVSEEPWSMNPSGYTDKPLTERDERTLLAVNRVKDAIRGPLCALRDEAKDGDSVLCHATALYHFLRAMDAEGHLASLAEREEKEGRVAEADALSRLFGVLCNLLDTAADTVGTMHVSRVQFAEMLDILFSSVSFGQLPTSKDAVTIGSADMLRASEASYTYLLGANEGEFPAPVVNSSAFADSERRILISKGLPLSFDPLIRASREQFSFLRALSSASTVATVISYETDASGKAMHPSAAFLRLEAMLGKASAITKIEAFTPRAALEGYQSKAEKEALRELLADDDVYARYFKAEDVPLSETTCQIDEGLATSLFGTEIRMSQSRFESYASCPFAYYCQHLLQLDKGEDASFGAADIGSFVHAVLEKLFLAIKDDGKTIKTIEKSALEGYVNEVCREYVSAVCPREFKDSPRLNHLFSRLKRTTILLAEELFDEFSRSDFSPTFFELPIGRKGSPDPIAFTLSDGAKMIFHGIIDRVDTYRHEDGKLYVRVIDYKTGSKSFSLDDVQKGKNLQMLLYLFSLWKNKNPIFADGESVLPAGVMYVSASPKDTTLEAPKSAEQVRADAKASLTRSGLILEDEDIVRAMDKTLSGHFVPLTTDSDGHVIWNEHFASLEKMGELLTQMQETVKEIGSGMRRGCAHAEPSDMAKDKSGAPCRFCSFNMICRRK